MFLNVLLLAACVGMPAPQVQYYLLRMTDTPVEDLPVSTISLTALEVAPYLKQDGMILERADGQIVPARFHQWAEPLDFSVQNFVQRSISVLYGEEFLDLERLGMVPSLVPSTELAINIDQLHGTADGKVKLVASWTISRPKQAVDKELIHHRFVEYQSLGSDGYPALAEAHRELLQRFALAIVESLPKSPSAPINGPTTHPKETVF